MNLASNDFELFDIEPRFAIDRDLVDQRWRALQTATHPDKFAADGAAAQRLSMQWAVRINEAYRRLKDPLKRAAYLCELNGAAIDAESNTAMPTAVLMKQMEWREALDDAEGVAQIESLSRDVEEQSRWALTQLEGAIDERRDFPEAARQVRALMFTERFAQDIDRRLEALGQ